METSVEEAVVVLALALAVTVSPLVSLVVSDDIVRRPLLVGLAGLPYVAA